MREILTRRAVQGLMLLSLTAATSCVDNDYDLSKDIDMTVTLGGNNLVIPASSTDDITLEDIFDLEEGSALKAITAEEVPDYPGLKEGDYVLHKRNDSDSETLIGVDEINVPMETYQEGISDPMTFVKEPGMTQSASMQVENMKAAISLANDNVTRDVNTINWADVRLNLQLGLSFTGSSNATRLTLKRGFEFAFPEYVTISSVGHSNVTIKNNHILHFDADYVLTRNNTAPISVTVSHVDFPAELAASGQGLYEPGHFRLDMDVVAEGEAYVAASDFPANESVLQLQVKGYVRSTGDLLVDRMNGKVDPDVDIELDPVNVTGIPDFLTNEDTRLDLSNPKVNLIVTNHTPVSVNLSATLQSFGENGELLAEVGIGDTPERPDLGRTESIVLRAESSQVLTFVRHKTAEGEIEVEDMNTLIERIPSVVQMANIRSKVVQEDITVETGKDRYAVYTGVDVVAPLSFGEHMNLVYEDEMDDWNSDIKDYEISRLEVELEATNKIPLELIMKFDESKGEEPSVYAIDEEGNRIEEITVKVDENYGVLKAGSLERPQNSTVKLTLTAPAGSMKRLDGLKYRLRAAASSDYQDIQMNKHQTLTFTSIRLRIKDGIKIDMN